MSSVIYICKLCGNDVFQIDKQVHARSHKGPAAARTDLGGKVISESAYVMMTYAKKGAASNNTVPLIITVPSTSAADAMGLTSRNIDAAVSGLAAAGSILSEGSTVEFLNYFQREVYKCDPASFWLSFAEWMVTTQGSTEEADAGSIMLQPIAGSTEEPMLVPMITVFDCLRDFGQILKIQLTPRKLFQVRSIYDRAIGWFVNHQTFASYRQYGTIKSNHAGFPPSEFYKALPSYGHMTSIYGLSAAELKQLENARILGVVQPTQAVPDAVSFDPNLNNPMLRPTGPPTLSPQDQFTTNAANRGIIQGMIAQQGP